MYNGRLKNKGVRGASSITLVSGLISRAICPYRPHILVACMPKSGSTFLTNLIASYGLPKPDAKGINKLMPRLTKIRHAKLVPEYGDREQELCELRLLSSHSRSYVSQQHIKNSEWTQEMIQRYSLTPVILIRNLADCVMSIRDHIRKEKHFGSIIRVDQHVLALNNEDLERLIIQVGMPWYLSFYEGWIGSQSIILTYEDVVGQPAGTLKQVLESAGVAVEARLIQRAVDQVGEKPNRLNVGVSGRGSALSSDNCRRLEELISLFPAASSNEYLRRV